VGQKLSRFGMALVAPAAGIGVYALGRNFGEQTATEDFWCGVAAFAGVLTIRYPAAFFGMDAPGWWFSGNRPGPSNAYLWSSRIAGVVMVVGSVLAVLFLSEAEPPVIPGLDPVQPGDAP
jgi:hypothetical protein